MSNEEYLENNYNELINDYGGKIILIRDKQVKFADKSTKVVLNYAKKYYPDKKWLITRIDSGDAALYGIKISNNESDS